jgi:hypothetical protein
LVGDESSQQENSANSYSGCREAFNSWADEESVERIYIHLHFFYKLLTNPQGFDAYVCLATLNQSNFFYETFEKIVHPVDDPANGNHWFMDISPRFFRLEFI